jgi:hypothetical protein
MKQLNAAAEQIRIEGILLQLAPSRDAVLGNSSTPTAHHQNRNITEDAFSYLDPGRLMGTANMPWKSRSSLRLMAAFSSSGTSKSTCGQTCLTKTVD